MIARAWAAFVRTLPWWLLVVATGTNVLLEHALSAQRDATREWSASAIESFDALIRCGEGTARLARECDDQLEVTRATCGDALNQQADLMQDVCLKAIAKVRREAACPTRPPF